MDLQDKRWSEMFSAIVYNNGYTPTRMEQWSNKNH